MEYYLAGLAVFKEIKSLYGISVSYDDIGMVHQKKGNFEEALKNHLAALKISSDGHYSYGMASSYSNIGSVYFLQSNNAEALKNYFISLKLFKEIEDKEGLAKVNNSIGETYFRMKDFTESRKYFNEALASAKDFGGKQIIANSYEYLTNLDSAEAKWDLAYLHQKYLLLYRDSLLNEENKNKMFKNLLDYEFSKKEDSLNYKQALTDEKLKQQVLLARQQKQDLLIRDNEVVMLNKEKEIQKLQLQKNQVDYALQKSEADKKQEQLRVLNKEKTIQSLDLKKQKQEKKYLIAGLFLFLVLSFFVYNGYRTRQKLKLQTLRNKIASDLHDDVGSTLSSISIFSQMALEETKEVKPMLQTIGESSRKMLDAMADIVWTINPDNDQFEKIIMRMRSFAYELLGAKQIDFRFIADSNIANIRLSMEARRNLYLIFKEATNNLVKYADATQAMFSIKEDNGKLVMLIKDNGKGFDSHKQSAGNGLKNMKKRAGELGAILLIDSMPGTGTTIQLELAV
jgi:signal transduction histidine kinase